MTEFSKPTESDIQTIKAANPGQRLRMLSAHGAALIVRRPSEAEFARMQVTVSDGGSSKRLMAANQLLRDVCLWPSKDELNGILAELPGLGLTMMDDVLDLMGFGGEVEKKDL